MIRTAASRTLVALATSAVVLPAAPAMAQTAQDTAPPQVVSVNIQPATVDVTTGPATVTVTVCATDPSGVREVNLGLLGGPRPFNAQSTTPTSGTRQNGCFAVPVQLPLGTGPGTYELFLGGIFDTVGNGTAFTPRREDKVTVTNGTPIPASQVVTPNINGGAGTIVASPGVALTLSVIGTPNATALFLQAPPNAFDYVPVRSFTFDAQGRATLIYTPAAGRSSVYVLQQNVIEAGGFVSSRGSNTLFVEARTTTPTTPPTTPPTQPPAPQPTVQPQVTATPTPVPTSTATPTPRPTVTPTTPAQVPVDIDSEFSVIEYGDTVLVAAFGRIGARADLYGNGKLIRSGGVLESQPGQQDGIYLWELQPGDTTSFSAVVDGRRTKNIVVRVRRTVTIGIAQASGLYTFTGTIRRAQAGVQVTVARLDAASKRVTGVASALTNAAGNYTIRTRLPIGQAGFYTLTAAASGLDAGRSRLYGLVVPRPAPVAVARPVAAAPRPVTSAPRPVAQPTAVYYANCDAVRRAGRAPLYAGQPGYRTGLDRDRGGPDGIACE